MEAEGLKESMEEQKPVATAADGGNHTVASVPPPQETVSDSRPQSNQKPLSVNAKLMNSPYFKIRALVRQLRPQFLEILKTPDFRNCQAAHEIRLQMKRLQELYKELAGETGQSGESLEKMPTSHQEGSSQDTHLMEESGEPNCQTFSVSSEKKPDDVVQNRVSYIVGGSAFGWNFITYLGDKPVYNGVSKESFRSRQKKGLPTNE